MVADSSPSNAQSVKVAAAVTPLTESGIFIAGAALLECSDMRPSAPTASSGRIFNTVVTPCTQPEALIPYQFTKVSSHKQQQRHKGRCTGFLGDPGQ